MAYVIISAARQKSRLAVRELEDEEDRYDVLCPPEQRRRSGPMETALSTVIKGMREGANPGTGADEEVYNRTLFQRIQPDSRVRQGNDGVTWLPRFAVLSDDMLAFAKAEGDETIIDFIPLAVRGVCLYRKLVTARVYVRALLLPHGCMRRETRPGSDLELLHRRSTL